MNKNKKYLGRWSIFFTLLFCSTQIHAANDGSPSLLKNKQSCLSSPHICIKQIDKTLKDTITHSNQWYRLVNFKLLAIWEIRDAQQLRAELHQYINLDLAPPVFHITVYTLYAKIQLADGKTEQGTLYANKAVELIKQVNSISFDADRYAEIIILYNQLNQQEKANNFITWIKKRIARMGPEHYFPKLQTAIAHNYFQSNKFALALEHYQYALTGFIVLESHLETAEGYHNIARALQGKKEYKQAISAFEKALLWMNDAVETGAYAASARNYTQLRLAETLQQNNQHHKTKQLLTNIVINKVNKGNLALYNQLKSKLHLE